jgi:transposase InsO family protein
MNTLLPLFLCSSLASNRLRVILVPKLIDTDISLHVAQKRYTTGEQELLSIVETLKEFRNILLGQKVIVHTDHKNILYGILTNDRITRWRLLLEEFGPEYHHVKGEHNVVADALSRIHIKGDENASGQEMAYCMSRLIRSESINVPEPTSPQDMATCFAGSEDVEFEQFPMKPALIAREQAKDKKLQKKIRESRRDYTMMKIEGYNLLSYQGKIVIPDSLQGRIVAWYHKYLAHPGMTRMEATLRTAYVWSGMQEQIRRHVGKCKECQLNKGSTKKYGHLPPKDMEAPEPWNRINIDLIGPWTVKTPKGNHELRALTIIDPATGWFEMKEIGRPNAHNTAAALDDAWLSRYPRPQIVGYDGGSEFKGVFAETIKNYGLTEKVGTAYNPQSNGIIERVHQVIADALRTFELEKRELDKKDPWTPFLQAACFAVRSTYHTTLGATPAQLVFGRDMMLPIKFKANWTAIQQRRLQEVQRNNKSENMKRIPHNYEVGDRVSKTRPGIQPKLSSKRDGPYDVIAVYDNGTIRIRCGPTEELINIRRVTPFKE